MWSRAIHLPQLYYHAEFGIGPFWGRPMIMTPWIGWRRGRPSANLSLPYVGYPAKFGSSASNGVSVN